MRLLNIFKRKNTASQNMEVVNKRRAQNRAKVVQAVKEIGKPCTGRMVSNHLGWDSASVTNRLAEAAKKGELKIAFNKRGLDGIWRHYYVAANK